MTNKHSFMGYLRMTKLNEMYPLDQNKYPHSFNEVQEVYTGINISNIYINTLVSLHVQLFHQYVQVVESNYHRRGH